jgi:transglutaminase-like putative cysteine protease
MNNPRLHRLTINFAILAFLAAFLLGLGPRSSRLTYMIGIGIVVSYILTDRLQLLVLPRLAAYFAMLAGAIAAIGELIAYNRNFDQLAAVASLLVYVQFGLMFQKKDRQVFEQWAAFVLLELIVAALINDNVLYGVMLVPVLFIGCTTMLAYSSYVSSLKSGQSGRDSNSFIARALKWMGRDTELRPTTSGKIKMVAEKSTINPDGNADQMIGVQRSAALVFNIIVFAIAFFYIMPRLQSGAYEGEGWSKPVVGFSGEVSLEQVGELLQSDAAAMKVRFKSLPGNKDMRPIEPPYFRGAVCHVYVGGGRWESANRGPIISGTVVDALPASSINPQLTDSTDGVEITVQEQTTFDDATFSIPPFARNSIVGGTAEVVAGDWTILDKDRGKPAQARSKQEYRFRTYGFTSGFQSRLLPVFDDCKDLKLERAVDQAKQDQELYILKKFPGNLPGIVALREKIFASEESKEVGAQVLAMEDYLVTSPEFKYSLAPSEKRRNEVDPIEDFVSNHKTGHCQYFASTLAMMLRSMEIPSRIVLGFRPADFNESGMFFVVRQLHAHAWVEAYLTREQLASTGLDIPDYVTEGAWLRLDPTPEGEGSNAGGSLRSRTGQLENFQQLWQDYVLGRDSSDRSEILELFNAKDQTAFGAFRLSVARAIASLQSNRLMAGLLSPADWFSLRGAFVVMAVIIVAVILLQIGMFILKRVGVLRWKRSLSPQRLIGMKFYRRVLQALHKLHLKRAPHQTPLEFAKQVEEYFRARTDQFGDVVPNVQFLTSLYYRLRFGFDVVLQDSEWQEIETATQSIERLAASRSRTVKV